MEDPLIDSAGLCFFYGGPIAGLVVGIWIARGTPGSELRKALAGASIGAGCILFSFLAAMAIVFRDGLGPGFVPSTGMESWLRALPDFGIALLLGGIAAAPGMFLRRRRRMIGKC